MDDMIIYQQIQSSRLGRLICRIIRLLICLCVSLPLTVFTSAHGNLHSLSLSSTIHHITEPARALEKETEKQQKAHNNYVLLMAKLESQSRPRVTAFNTDAFNMAANKCASKTCTPYASDLYEKIPVLGVKVKGVGKSSCTFRGKAKYKYVDNAGDR
jgi:hypothetical protein